MFVFLQVKGIVRINAGHELLAPVVVGQLIDQPQPVGEQRLGRVPPGDFNFLAQHLFQGVCVRGVAGEEILKYFNAVGRKIILRQHGCLADFPRVEQV